MAQTLVEDGPRPSEPAVDTSPLDRTLDLSRLGWQPLAWLAVIGLALCLRLLWLDSWALAPGEAASAEAIWNLLLRGEPTTAPPEETGPIVHLLGVLWFFLFGVFDQTARFGPALAGTALVASLWWLRPWLGQLAALVAALLLALSPLAIYGSRRLTPESYAALGLVILAIGLLRLQAGGGRGALVAAVLGGLLAVFSHYLALPLALLLIGLAPLARRLAGTSEMPPGARLPAPARLGRDDWLVAGGVGLTGLLLLVVLTAAGGATMLANLASPLTAWAAVAPAPGRSPLALPLLLVVYEPLILVGAIVGAWTLGSARETPAGRLAGLFVALWAIVALLVAALLGDRDPAQVLYALVPLALLAGRAVAGLIEGIDWGHVIRGRGLVLAGVSLLAVVCLLLCLSTLSPATATIAPGQVLLALIYFLMTLLLIMTAVYLARPLGLAMGGRIVALTLLTVLLAYGVRSAVALAYIQPDSAVEPAVQDQPTPGLLSVVDRINRLSRDLTGLRRSTADPTGGHGLEIAIDAALARPFEWYLREYTQRTRFDPAAGLPGNPQLVLVSAAGEEALRPILERGYVAQRYPFSWSFPTGGIGGSGLSGLVRFFLYREPAVPPTAQDYALYLRRDVADRSLFVGGASAPAAAGPAFNLFDGAGRGRANGQFDAPRGVATDGEGNIYVVDTANTRLQKFDAQGEHLWSVGSAGSGNGQFGKVQNGPGPTGVAVDGRGNIYVADTWNHRIVKLDPSGRFVTTWGGFFNTQGNAELGRQHPREFYGPRSIAVGPNDTLYVTDTGNKRVLVFDADGQPLRQWGGLGSGPANLNEPVGIAVADGVVYVADTYNGRIATFDPEGKPLAQWPVSGWGPNIYQEPYLAVGPGGVHVTNTPGRSVLTFDRSGRLLAEERRAGERELVSPTGIAVAPDGSQLIVDTGANVVLRTGP